MSTPNLRAAAEQGVDLTRAGHCRASLLVVATLFGSASLMRARLHLKILGIGLTFLFFLIIYVVSSDRRAFAVAAFVKVSFVGVLAIIVYIMSLDCDPQNMS